VLRKFVLPTGVLVGAISFVPSDAFGQLRVVQYNVSEARAGVDTVLQAIGTESRSGIARPIDILTVQEQMSLSGSTQDLVNLLNGIYGTAQNPTPYARGTLQGATTGGGRPAIIYNTQTVQLLNETTVGTAVANGQTRQTLRYLLRPVGYTSTADFYLYSSHYKASPDDPSDPVPNTTRRNIEAQAIRANSDALGNAHVIYAGDLNLYTSAEPAYQTLLAAGNGQALDPVNTPGDWHDGFSFRSVHTQSPATSSVYGGQVAGGIDDRFDFQLLTGEMLDNEGLSYISGTYRAFGNNGTHALNGKISTGSGATSAVRSALASFSDHLPVIADYTYSSGLAPVSVPEPGSMALVMLAAGRLLCVRRRGAAVR